MGRRPVSGFLPRDGNIERRLTWRRAAHPTVAIEAFQEASGQAAISGTSIMQHLREDTALWSTFMIQPLMSWNSRQGQILPCKQQDGMGNVSLEIQETRLSEITLMSRCSISKSR